MTTTNLYPNSFYVVKYIGPPLEWYPLIGSVSTYKTYAKGFLEACDGFQPHEGYRLIGKNGEVLEEKKPRGKPHVNQH